MGFKVSRRFHSETAFFGFFNHHYIGAWCRGCKLGENDGDALVGNGTEKRQTKDKMLVNPAGENIPLTDRSPASTPQDVTQVLVPIFTQELGL